MSDRAHCPYCGAPKPWRARACPSHLDLAEAERHYLNAPANLPPEPAPATVTSSRAQSARA